MQMNVTSPAFTGKTAYTKNGNEYRKTNTFAKVGLGVGLAAAAGVAAYDNKEALGKIFTKENGQKALDSIGKFFKETIPNFFKKSPKVTEAAAEAAAEAAETVADAAAETAKKPGKIKAFFNSISESIRNIDMKKAGKATGKAAVIAAPLVVLVAAGLLVDKLVNNKKAREADLNA